MPVLILFTSLTGNAKRQAKWKKEKETFSFRIISKRDLIFRVVKWDDDGAQSRFVFPRVVGGGMGTYKYDVYIATPVYGWK